MESLNLNALAGSLPTSNLANAEKELLNNFRGTYSLFLSRSPHAEIDPTHVSPRHFFFRLPTKKKNSCRDEHNEPLSVLTLDLEARVQLGLRRGVRRPAPDDPAGRV